MSEQERATYEQIMLVLSEPESLTPRQIVFLLEYAEDYLDAQHLGVVLAEARRQLEYDREGSPRRQAM